MGTSVTIDHPVILFDGVCNLCNGSVQFIIVRDKKGLFRYASLQSAYGEETMKQFGLPSSELNSILLRKGEKLYRKSSAVLEITRHLNGLWPALYIFKLVPAFLRDLIYDWIARNRYRWFGRSDECMIPTAEWKARFL